MSTPPNSGNGPLPPVAVPPVPRVSKEYARPTSGLSSPTKSEKSTATTITTEDVGAFGEYAGPINEETKLISARQSVGSTNSIFDHFVVADHDILPDTPLNSYHRLERSNKTCFDSFKGILCMLVSTVVTSLHPSVFYYSQTVKKIPYSKSTYIMWSYIMYIGINIIPAGALLYYKNETVLRPFKENKKIFIIYILRGLVGAMYLLLQWNAIHYFGRPAPISVILAMAPIFVYINAFFVLKEKLGIVPIVNAFIAVGGVLVMNIPGLENPEEGKNALIGSALGFAAMLVISWSTVLVRLLREVHPILVNMSFGVFGVLLAAIVAAANGTIKVIEQPDALGLCFLTAVISTVSNIFFNLALKFEQAGINSLVKTSEVIFNFIYQMTFFGIPPTLYDGIGGLIVVLGVICVTLRKIVNDSTEDSWLRAHLGFLLR